ncbi:MAG TPA: GGDEF domain-containing protein [Castellaniella sp.]|nr:GGDEF domain-containing protein [Castellaniella sp.]
MHRTISRNLCGARRLGRFIPVAALAFLLIRLSLEFRPLLGPIGFWPANALLAGLLLRMPTSQQLSAWMMVTVGTALSYGLWYGTWHAALLNGAVDLPGVWLVWYLLARVWQLETLRTPRAIVKILAAGMAGSLCTALAGLMAQLWHEAYLQTMIEVLLRQWLGYSAILPVCLLAARGERRPVSERRHDRKRQWRRWRLRLTALSGPLGALAAAAALAILLGGPGAIAFPIPALLLCAHVYQQRTTAWLILITALGLVVARTQGWGLLPPGTDSVWAQISLQMGLQLLVATPLLVSSSLAARNDLVLALNQALDHDELTEALARQAFMRGATEYLQQSPAAFHGNGVMMLDIDHFKRLNDNHGHAAGDSVLREFARVIRASVRPQDLFGRLGGEEFGIVLPNTTPQNTQEIAERLRASVEKIRLYYDSDEPLRVTVSIGAVHDSQMPGATLSTLLSSADQAMYYAKHHGRNQVYCLSAGEMRDLNPVPQI